MTLSFSSDVYTEMVQVQQAQIQALQNKIQELRVLIDVFEQQPITFIQNQSKINFNEYILQFSDNQTKRIQNGDKRTDALHARITKTEMDDMQATLDVLKISQSCFIRSLLNFYQNNKTNLYNV